MIRSVRQPVSAGSLCIGRGGWSTWESWRQYHGSRSTRGRDLSDRRRRDAEAEPHGWDGMGMGLGRLAARLDERDAASICLSLPAAHDRQSDGLVDQEPRRLHGDLARVDCAGKHRFPVRRRGRASGGTGSTASSARGSSPGTPRFSFAPSRRARGSWSAARPTISSATPIR